MVADDLDGVLVCANGTVGTETKELAAKETFRSGVDFFCGHDVVACYVIYDTNGEMILRGISVHIVEYGFDHGRREFLAAHTIAAANNLSHSALFEESRDYIFIKRFAEGAGFFCSVENCDVLNGFWDSVNKCFCGERSVKSDFNSTELRTALGVEIVDRFFNCFCAGAHENDDIFSIRSAYIIKDVVLSAEFLCELVHNVLNDAGCCFVETVSSFSVLEIDVGVLCCASLVRVFGVKSSFAEFLNSVPIYHGFEVIIV